jgi:uncharacterized delta-60 repeat protein
MQSDRGEEATIMGIRSLAFTLLLAAPGPALAQPGGTLDASFGDAGQVFLPLSSNADRINAVAIDALGRIVGAGSARQAGSGNSDWIVVRLLADGTPDPGFGGGDGVVVLSLPGSNDEAWDLLLQPDGRIVVGGDVYPGGDPNVAVVRFEADGDLDPTFGGGDGRVDFSTSTGIDTDTLHALAPAGDGALVAAGYGGPGPFDLWAVRIEADGELDGDYGGGDGIARIDPGIGSGSLFDAAATVDGGVLLAGFQSPPGRLLLVRLDAAGGLDPDFDDDGIVQHDLVEDETEVAEAVALLPDGRAVVGGRGQSQPNSPAGDDVLVARIETDGALDPSFGGGDGWATLDLGSSRDNAYALALDAGGRIVLAGQTDLAQPNLADIAVARLLPDGAPDAGFGDGASFVRIDLADGQDEGLFGVAVQDDGRIVAAGRSPRPGNPSGYDSVFLRLHGGCLFCDGFESGDTGAWSSSP